jgi:leucyl aminopeptidase (aminopeptidase T)
MRQTDPFPSPYQGLTPTHSLKWEAMAQKLVRDVLQLERRERVLISADPYCGGAMLDAVRAEIQRAGGIELAAILHWTPALTMLRNPDGSNLDPTDARAEDDAMRGLFAHADVFIWLQNDWRSRRATQTLGQSERVLENWSGRSAHFHWFHDPANPDPDHPSNKALDLVYQDAILNLDYQRLSRRMHDLASRMSERELNITSRAGTDLRLRTSARFHINDGNASRSKAVLALSPRDREEELPCGALRTIPLLDSVEGIIALQEGFGFPAMGHGLDIDRWLDRGLRFIFEKGRVRKVETDGDQVSLDRAWRVETGDKDRLGEFVLGCNPLLPQIEALSFPPYHGFGDAILRLTLGENIESGGRNHSSLHRWLMFFDADIRAATDLLVSNGRLTGSEGQQQSNSSALKPPHDGACSS